MIERWQVTAAPVGGGERVVGCPVKYGDSWQIWVERDGVTWNYVIDPATIEPVRVKPDFDGHLYACPNCRMIELHNSRNHFCPHCGQALDWGGSP